MRKAKARHPHGDTHEYDKRMEWNRRNAHVLAKRRDERVEKLIEVRKSYTQVLDETSKDDVIDAGFSRNATDRARQTVESWRAFVVEHRDNIEALQILYSRPYAKRLTLKSIKELAAAIGRPPYNWTPELLWAAYEALEARRVKGAAGAVRWETTLEVVAPAMARKASTAMPTPQPVPPEIGAGGSVWPPRVSKMANTIRMATAPI